MTRPDPNDPNASTRVGRDTPASGTSTGADVTSRMSGATGQHEAGAPTDTRTESRENYEERVKPAQYKTAKTSAAAVFALVFGLAALFCALTGILSPFAVLFGLIGIVLGIAGLKMAKRAGVTGRGVAIGGLVTAVLGLLLGAGVLAGLAVAVNSDSNLNRISQFVDDARGSLPSGQQLESDVKDVVR